MGLAISKTILEAHGGRLWAVPNPAGGATFHGTLPLVDEIQTDAD
jgi:two-component system sensor kinase FixL